MTQPRYLVLLGPPGAGKGTQAAMIASATGVVHVSTGDLFRENVQRGTELGRAARQYMDQGKLVPDEVTIRMLLERLERPDCEKGALLDGFPRTVAQAKALDEALAEPGSRVQRALLIEVSDEELERRLTSRWVCREGGEIYNVLTNPPRVPGRCDVDGGELYQREDDRPEAVRRRLEVFHRETEPVIDYYERQGKLTRVNGERDVASVGRALVDALEAKAR